MTHYSYSGKQPLTAAERLAMEHAETGKTRPIDKLENIEFLIRCGCPLDEALERSGYNSLAAFQKAASRHGRQDLTSAARELLAS